MLLSKTLVFIALGLFVVVLVSGAIAILKCKIKLTIITGIALILLTIIMPITDSVEEWEFVDSFEEGVYIVDVDKTIITCGSNDADELALILKNKGIDKCNIQKDLNDSEKFRCTIEGIEGITYSIKGTSVKEMVYNGVIAKE